MFCSNCGKTMPENERKCPFCGLEILDSSFFESSITSCQPKNLPGEEFETSGKYANVTRTVFTGTASHGSGVSGTTYRTAYEPAPDEVFPEEPAAEYDEPAEGAPEVSDEPAAEEEPIEEDELQEPKDVELTEASRKALEGDTLRLDGLKMRPIEASAPKGISRGVREYMEAMREEDEMAKAKPKSRFLFRANDEEDDTEDEAEDIPAAPVRKAEKPAGREEDGEDTDEDDDEEGESIFTRLSSRLSRAPKDSEESEDEEEAEDENEEPVEKAPRRAARKPMSKKKKAKLKGILRTVGVIVLIVAVLFGVIAGIAIVNKKSQKPPIPGVSLALYNKGTSLIKSHVSADYKKNCLNLYSTGVLDFTTKLENSKEAVAALSNEAEDVFDAQFVEALNVIETNINNALTMDALATLQTNPDEQTQAIADSNARWATINESVDGLLNATTTVEIEAIIRGEKIEIPKETPKPTATPVVYSTLSKGMKVAAVTDLQTRLFELGFYEDEIDGAYGNKTVTAVKLFQSACGLEVTGTADPATLAAVYDENAPRTGSKVTPVPEAAAAAPAPEG